MTDHTRQGANYAEVKAAAENTSAQEFAEWFLKNNIPVSATALLVYIGRRRRGR